MSMYVDPPKYFTSNGWSLRLDGPRNERWLFNNEPGSHGKFVARFKYMKPTASAKRFARFLVTHFTPTEYFEALSKVKENGYSTSPMEVLWSRGFPK